MTATYSGSPNQLVSAANGVDYAYRETGEGPVPLVLLQHFRGNLDNWAADVGAFLGDRDA
jgi:pimeloyl-ACP methyl ester carboxylesterase